MRKLVVLTAFGLLLGFGWWRRAELLPRDEINHAPSSPRKSVQDEHEFVKAIVDGQRDLVFEALDAGFTPNARNRFGDSALIWAVHYGDEVLAKALIERGANLNQAGTHGFTPLHWSAKKGVSDLTRLLIERSAAIDARDDSGETALMIAARNNDVAIIEILLRAKADPNAVNKKGESALMLALAHDADESVEILVLAEANPLLAANTGESPLSLAVKMGKQRVFLTRAIERRYPDIRQSLAAHVSIRIANIGDRPNYSIQNMEKMVHDLTNRQRRQNGLPDLDYDHELAAIARAHSADMANRGFFNHINPDRDDPTARAKRAGYPIERKTGSLIRVGIGENIFQGATFSGASSFLEKGVKQTTYKWMTPDQITNQAVSGWMKSPGHRANILDPDHRGQGIGISIDHETVTITQNLR